MAIAKELTPSAWILESNTGDKLGIISYNRETEKYRIISEDTNLEFNTMEEFEIMINERITFAVREQASAVFKDIDGYPIAHETPVDVTYLDNGRIAYLSSKRKTKRFYAGYWTIPNSAPGTWYTKISLSEDLHDKIVSDGYTPIGPFKDKVEALFAAKQAETAERLSTK